VTFTKVYIRVEFTRPSFSLTPLLFPGIDLTGLIFLFIYTSTYFYHIRPPTHEIIRCIPQLNHLAKYTKYMDFF
jgi:hypothetical protein